MTDPARIEAAARAILAVADGYAWGRMTRAYRDVYVTRARFICDTAYPELANGTAWLAPMEATEEMLRATLADRPFADCGGRERRDFDEEWAIARDAHLKSQG